MTEDKASKPEVEVTCSADELSVPEGAQSLFPSDLHLEHAQAQAQKEDRPVSELLFEAYCATAQIRCNRIEEEKDAKTPDYELTIDDQLVIAEVKELGMNMQTREAEQSAKKGFAKAVVEKVGERVRNKINKAGRQIRKRTAGRYPSMLVLYDDGRIGTLHVHITAAMYGTTVVDMAVPQDRSIRPYPVGQRLGPGKKMTPGSNTSISAIGVIFRDAAADWDFRLLVYHNAHAAIPIEPKLLAGRGIRQCRMDLDSMEWKCEEEQ